jgi:ribosome modulation factor
MTISNETIESADSAATATRELSRLLLELAALTPAGESVTIDASWRDVLALADSARANAATVAVHLSPVPEPVNPQYVKQGRTARKVGEKRESCPFTREEFARDWQFGWDQADAEITKALADKGGAK